MSVYHSTNYLVLDFETTSTHDYGSAVHPDNRLIMACWANGHMRCCVGSEYKQQELVAAIEKVDFIIAHNAKFELQWLRRCGVDTTHLKVYDTMLAEYVLAGNRSWPLNLNAMGHKYTGVRKDPFVDKCMKAGICPSEMPTSLLVQRCKQDVRTTYQVFRAQLPLLEGKLHLVEQRSDVCVALADIEFNGMCLDRERVVLAYEDAMRKSVELEAELNIMSSGINLNSPKQLGEFVYDTLGFKEMKNRRGEPLRTPSGNRKTDQITLTKLKATTPEQEKFIELRREYGRVNALLTKNLEFFSGACAEQDGVFTAQFNQAVTRTHRLSSSGVKRKFGKNSKAKSVQFQNLPRGCKPLFCARHRGWRIMEVDGSQLEFRVAAYLGQDEQAVSDITGGVDVHQNTADILSAAGQPTDRQAAKAHTFKPLYGGSSGTKAEQTYYSAFKERYSGVAAAQQRWMDRVLTEKCLVTESGLTFYWPNTTVQDGGYITNTTSICNYPVQSLATAEIIPLALINLWSALSTHKMESFIVNTIHDSVILEVHPDEIETVKALAIDSFTRRVYVNLKERYNIDFNVPLGCGIKIGTHWNEGTETSHEGDITLDEE